MKNKYYHTQHHSQQNIKYLDAMNESKDVRTICVYDTDDKSVLSIIPANEEERKAINTFIATFKRGNK